MAAQVSDNLLPTQLNISSSPNLKLACISSLAHRSPPSRFSDFLDFNGTSPIDYDFFTTVLLEAFDFLCNISLAVAGRAFE